MSLSILKKVNTFNITDYTGNFGEELMLSAFCFNWKVLCCELTSRQKVARAVGSPVTRITAVRARSRLSLGGHSGVGL